MTPRERIYASLSRSGFDALPWQFDMTSVIRQKLMDYYDTEDLLTATGDHIVWAGLGAPRGYEFEEPGPGLVKSEFGTVWTRSVADRSVGDWGGAVEYPLSGPSLVGYHFPDGAAPGRADYVPQVRETNPEHFLVVGGAGLFEPAWAMCGFEQYLEYLVGEESFVRDLTEKLADFSCTSTAQLAGMKVDGMRFGDDWGFQDHLMARPEVWRRIYKEPYRRIYQAAREIGAVVMIHSCGNITQILPDLIEIGVQVIHPLQPECMDVEFCQREFGQDVAFWGGLGSQSTIPLGTVEDLRAEIKHRLELFKAGGYILAPAGAIPTDAPVENVVAIIEEVKNQLKNKVNNRYRISNIG